MSREEAPQDVVLNLGRFNLPEQQHITCLVLDISLSREVVYLLALRHRLNMMFLENVRILGRKICLLFSTYH